MVHGEAKEVWGYIRTVKADKSCKDFCFFATFFSKKKVDEPLKAVRLSLVKINFCRVFSEDFSF